MIAGFDTPAPRGARAHRVIRRLVCLTLLAPAAGFAQGRTGPAGSQPPATAPQAMVERLGRDLFRLGKIRVNTATREVSVPATVNPVSTLEFLANTPRGLKAYESALTLESDGITFNTALVLIGLERANARLLPDKSIDGDRVELWIEIPGTPPRRMRAERLVFDRATDAEIPEGTWVYTGSMFLENGRYMADADGILIGFIHSRSAVIDHPDTIGVGRYGSIVLNTSLGLQPGAALTLIVKAVGATEGRPK